MPANAPTLVGVHGEQPIVRLPPLRVPMPLRAARRGLLGRRVEVEAVRSGGSELHSTTRLLSSMVMIHPVQPQGRQTSEFRSGEGRVASLVLLGAVAEYLEEPDHFLIAKGHHLAAGPKAAFVLPHMRPLVSRAPGSSASGRSTFDA